MNTDTITADVPLNLLIPDSTPMRVPVTFSYCQQDSYAVTLDFFHVGHPEYVRWIFARDLLANGLIDFADGCDVRIKREGSIVLIELSSPEGRALLEADHDMLSAFLKRTYVMVPAGTECFDADGVIAWMLDES